MFFSGPVKLLSAALNFQPDTTKELAQSAITYTIDSDGSQFQTVLSSIHLAFLSNMTCWLCGFETTKLATNANAPTCKNGPCQICIAVAEIDKEINQAAATLRRLLSKRCDLRSEQNRIHGTLIHRLPTEIKSYIFELLVPKRNELGKIPSSDPPYERPVIPYTSICRNWRDIAWSNPFLWTTIYIVLRRRNVPSSDPSGQINVVQDWILRSRTLPLTLHIVEYDKAYSKVESKAIIGVICQYSNRWHSLSFDVSLELLSAFHYSNIQCHLLKNLRINGLQLDTNYQPVPLSNPTMSPESIDICDAPFRSLQISWNHLTSAKVECFCLGDMVQLFQHAPQLTYCSILDPYDDVRNFPIPIIHHRLKSLRLYYAREAEAFLGSLTLPCLQEFHADEMIYLKCLPALVHRSSCPLARITFHLTAGKDEWGLFDHLQPLPGMTHLVIETPINQSQMTTIRKLLFEGFFPDLRHVTFHLEAFHYLWDEGVITLLLDRKRPRLGVVTSGKHCKILVLDRWRSQTRTGVFNIMEWDSAVGEHLKSLHLDISLREDGFEILIPEG